MLQVAWFDTWLPGLMGKDSFITYEINQKAFLIGEVSRLILEFHDILLEHQTNIWKILKLSR